MTYCIYGIRVFAKTKEIKDRLSMREAETSFDNMHINSEQAGDEIVIKTAEKRHSSR